MSLLDLPNELLLVVAEYLETEYHVPKDLCSLLCVNRRLACLLLPIFRKELFQHMGELWLIPIKWAILKNDLGLFRLLLKHGVDVNDMEERCLLSSTRINKATLRNHPEFLSTLQLAIGFGRKRMTKLLLQNGANNYTDCKRLTAVHTAVYFRQYKILKMLLRFGMDINARSYKGHTALHIAVMYGYKKSVMLLINRGASLTALDWEGCTPLNRASYTLPTNMNLSWRRYEIIKLLLDAGGEVYDLETLGEVVAWAAKQSSSSYMRGTWGKMCDIARGKAAPRYSEFCGL